MRFSWGCLLSISENGCIFLIEQITLSLSSKVALTIQTKEERESAKKKSLKYLMNEESYEQQHEKKIIQLLPVDAFCGRQIETKTETNKQTNNCVLAINLHTHFSTQCVYWKLTFSLESFLFGGIFSRLRFRMIDAMDITIYPVNLE